MSVADSEAVLRDFHVWSQTRLPDNSVTAFLRVRKADEDAARIEGAIVVLEDARDLSLGEAIVHALKILTGTAPPAPTESETA